MHANFACRGFARCDFRKESDLGLCVRDSITAAGAGFPNLQGSKSIQNVLGLFSFLELWRKK